MKEKLSLPKGWEIKTIGDVCVSASSNVSQNKLTDDEGDYPIYGASGLIKKVSFYHQDKPYLSIVKDGSGFGRITKMDAYTSVIGTLQYILPKENIDLDYLNYSLMSVDFKKYVSGAAIPHIYFKDYKNESFLWMPLPEQQHIVSILDEAFAAIAKAKANAEQNLKNAKKLFESYLQGIFEEKGEGWIETSLKSEIDLLSGFAFKSNYYTEKNEDILLVRGDNIMQGYFRWEDAKRWNKDEFEEYKRFQLFENDVVLAMDRPWVKAGLKCAMISKNELPSLLVQRTASLRCKKGIDSSFLFYLVKSTAFTNHLLGVQTGIGVPHISGKQILDFNFNKPPLKEQQTIVRQLDALRAETQKLEAVYQKKIDDLEELKKSILKKAFAGELKTSASASASVAKIIPLQKVEGISATDLQAGITAMALQRHLEQNQQHTFHHVKAEKIVHLSEYILNIDLERNPVKDAAGPNDFPHVKKVESRAAKAGFYTVFKKGEYYDYQQGKSIHSVIQKTQNCLGAKADTLSEIIDILAPMSTQQAEIVATVFAAWNNLILKGSEFNDEDIVTEARENWREEKLLIPRDKFFNAIEWMRKNELLIPKGNGKIVKAKSN